MLSLFHQHIWETFGLWPKCCQPIKFQDSLKCNIIRKKWMMKFIFCMQINIEVFCKMILSFWMSVSSHAQSTQNKFTYLCNIYAKARGMNFIFCLQINTSFLQDNSIILDVRSQTDPKYQKQPVHNIVAISQGKHKGWSWSFACW